MTMIRQNSLSDKILDRMKSSPKSIYIIRDFLDLSDYPQLSRTFRKLIKGGHVSKVRNGVFRLEISHEAAVTGEKLKQMLMEKANSLHSDAFLVEDFIELANLVEIRSAIDELIQDKRLLEFSDGIYCKAKDQGGEIVIDNPRGFKGVVFEALNRLGIAWRESLRNRVYEDLSPDVPSDVYVYIKGNFNRKFKYKDVELKIIRY